MKEFGAQRHRDGVLSQADLVVNSKNGKKCFGAFEPRDRDPAASHGNVSQDVHLAIALQKQNRVIPTASSKGATVTTVTENLLEGVTSSIFSLLSPRVTQDNEKNKRMMLASEVGRSQRSLVTSDNGTTTSTTTVDDPPLSSREKNARQYPSATSQAPRSASFGGRKTSVPSIGKPKRSTSLGNKKPSVAPASSVVSCAGSLLHIFGSNFLDKGDGSQNTSGSHSNWMLDKNANLAHTKEDCSEEFLVPEESDDAGTSNSKKSADSSYDKIDRLDVEHEEEEKTPLDDDRISVISSIASLPSSSDGDKQECGGDSESSHETDGSAVYLKSEASHETDGSAVILNLK